MKPQFVFSLLRVSTNILYVLMIFLTIVIFITTILRISGISKMKDHKPVFTHDVMAFGKNRLKPVVTYSADSIVSYATVPERYKLEVEPNSALGYFSFFATLVHLGIAIAILGLFSKIFRENNLIHSFKHDVYKRLVMLAIMFGLSDVFTLINYFIFGSLVKRSFPTPHFELITDVGNGLITGLVIYAIAIIYQKGLSIQEENELTV